MATSVLCPSGEGSRQLLDAKVKLISNTICNSRQLYDHSVDDNMICAGNLQKPGQDSCQVGDSTWHLEKVGPYTGAQRALRAPGREEGQRLAIQSRWAHLSSGKPESTPDQEGSASMPSQPLCLLLLTLILTRLVREVTVAIVQMLREIILVHSSWVGSAEQELAPLC